MLCCDSDDNLFPALQPYRSKREDMHSAVREGPAESLQGTEAASTQNPDTNARHDKIIDSMFFVDSDNDNDK